MSGNALKVLNQILAEQRKAAPDWPESEFFELFAARQVLRSFSLDNEELEAGLVDDSCDGGVDGFYVIVNGKLIRNADEAKDLKLLKQNIILDLVIVQATTEDSFQLKRIIRLKDTIEEIFDLERKDFSEPYNNAMLNAIDTFRTAHSVLLSKGFTFNASVFYVSKGDTPGDDEKLLRPKGKALEEASKNALPTITKCSFEFMGARELVELATKPPKSRHQLVCVTTVSPKDAGIVAFVKLKDYFRFITAESGELLDHIFDSNVRDYQGDVEVNRAIKDTLEHPGKAEFWWLNNGITILASKAEGTHGDLAVEQPQIVNGLQTSQVIYEYFKQKGLSAESGDRKLLVRIIESQDSDIQDQVIEATNSQTGISPASIWATDPLQRNIEKLFGKYSLFYDRRKNYWRNKDVPLAKIVGISELAQAVAAIWLQEPDHARARPARYFKDKDQYARVFSKDYPIDFYPVCASVKKKVATYLRTGVVERDHRTNLMFYVLMVVGCLSTKRFKPSIQEITKQNPNNVKDELIAQAVKIVRPIYDKLGADDKVAKGAELVVKVKEALEKKF